MPPKILFSLDDLYQEISIQENKHISFHHHFRNGDFVLNTVLQYYQKAQIDNLHLFPSSIFPNYTGILPLLKNNQVTSITTNYLNGPVAKWITQNGLKGMLRMQTHGGRARSIIEGLSLIDIAYIAAPTVDHSGNAIGYEGPSKCGSLGYAIADSIYAKIVVLITNNLISKPILHPEILGEHVDYIVVLDQIGDPSGIVSGTTAITTNPIGVKIAKDTAQLLDEIQMIKQGFSFQSGAGGVSLRVTQELRNIMKERHIIASFFSGGITKYHVQMLEEGLVEKLYDVQCFDSEAVDSIKRNINHIPISASMYANPVDPNQIISHLDIVILGATEIDTDFNVNVTTDSHQTIIGGSGGHSDTASESFITIIVSPLIKGRIPLIKDRVTTITTRGKNVDVLVTERGIAIHPNRSDLLSLLEGSSLPIMTIKALQQKAYEITGIPNEIKTTATTIGVMEDRTHEIIDYLYQKN